MSRLATVSAVACLGLPVLIVLMTLTAPSGDGGTWSSLIVEVQQAQNALHRELAATLQAVQEDGVSAAAWLITLSFVYGVLHAVGPGHGKVVITTYLMTQRSRLARGIGLSVLTSLFQGFTAIAAVGIGVIIVGQSLRHAQSTADNLELLSYTLVALAGLVLIISRVGRLKALLWKPNHSPNPKHATHAHSHDHDHHHDSHLDHDACCGHAHGPTAEQLEAPLSWKAIGGMALAVGIRPCSGAILVLLVAHSLQLHWTGVFAVLAMSLGTALAISILAAVAVYARSFAENISGRLSGNGGSLRVAFELVALLGGVVILTMGLILLQAAWTVPTHPLR